MDNTTSMEREALPTQIVNNIAFDEEMKQQNTYILILLSILVVIKVLEFIFKIYKVHSNNLKKKFVIRNAPLESMRSSSPINM